MQRRCDRQPGRLMTSLLAVALAVSTLAVPASASDAHACCHRVAPACPVTSIQCCTMGQRDRTPEPAPASRASVVASPDLASPAPVAGTPPAFRAAARQAIQIVRRLTSPPLLYLRHSTLLV
jgi:hypothetical protein